jgi:L-rhamnose-H+ transport protein
LPLEASVTPNPVLGVFFHWLGGLASASFYVPYRGVRRWSWETYWLVGGFFSWIIAPWILAIALTSDLFQVLSETPGPTIFWIILFGLLWGIGGLTFGLTMRYLGLSLGMAVVLGLCAAFGTLMPPIFSGVFFTQVLGTPSGRVILAGVFVCLVGIAAAGVAGIYKEREMSAEQKKTVIKEFDLKKGLAVATLSGVMSACFAYALAAGRPIKALTLIQGNYRRTHFGDGDRRSESRNRRTHTVRYACESEIRSDGGELSSVCACGNHLVLSILFLHHG